jgi:hypothetical protein
MIGEFLLPETTLRESGFGPEINLCQGENRRLFVTLNITRSAEQQSLDVCVWGSSDGTRWDPQPLMKLPRQFCCGTCRMVLDLTERTDVRWLRAHWQIARWGKGDLKPLFTIDLVVQEMRPTASEA